MSLTEWLGKHGVPGFRSKKKWKMAIATPVYLFIALFLILFISVALSGPTQQPTPAPQVNDDKEFIRIIKEADSIISEDHNILSAAIQKSDNIGAERYAEKLESDAAKYLNLLDKLKVSSKYKNIYDETNARFEDTKMTGEYYKASAQFLQSNDIEPSISDLTNAVKYMQLGTNSTKKETAHVIQLTEYYKAMAP